MITTNCLSFMWLTCDQAVLLRQLSRSPRKKKTPDRRLPERLQPGRACFSFIQYTSCILFDVTLYSYVSPAGQICAFSRVFSQKRKQSLASTCNRGKNRCIFIGHYGGVIIHVRSVTERIHEILLRDIYS